VRSDYLIAAALIAAALFLVPEARRPTGRGGPGDWVEDDRIVLGHGRDAPTYADRVRALATGRTPESVAGSRYGGRPLVPSPEDLRQHTGAYVEDGRVVIAQAADDARAAVGEAVKDAVVPDELEDATEYVATVYRYGAVGAGAGAAAGLGAGGIARLAGKKALPIGPAVIVGAGVGALAGGSGRAAAYSVPSFFGVEQGPPHSGVRYDDFPNPYETPYELGRFAGGGTAYGPDLTEPWHYGVRVL